MEAGQKQQRDREQGQSSLFGMLGGGRTQAARAASACRDAPAWGEGERLAFEKESLGFFITGHPLERFRAELAQWATRHHGHASRSWRTAGGDVGGIITGAAPHQDQEGRPHGHRSCSRTSRAAPRRWSSRRPTRRSAARLADDQVVLVKGKAEVPGRRQGPPARLRRPAARAGQAGRGALRDHPRARVAPGTGPKGERLRDILGAHRGDCPVTLELVRPGVYAVAVAPSAYFRVRPDAALRDEVEALLGPGRSSCAHERRR